MNFSIEKSIEILERTPDALSSLLQGLSEEWTTANEGGETWSAYDIVGHLVYCEKANWVPRMELILSDQPDKTFTSFNRLGQFEESKGKTLGDLLQEFKVLREENIALLRSKNLTDDELTSKGIHPNFGEVTLTQLLATWTVHDLSHTAQISRVMAKQYKEAVGPWVEFLRVLKL
jgi:uncharacterized damage-inducible protein DinB